MHFAAKVLALSLVDLYTNPELFNKAKAEFDKATEGKPYQSVFSEKF
jgi:hypothetical protein